MNFSQVFLLSVGKTEGMGDDCQRCNIIMTRVLWTYRSMDGNQQVDFGGVSEVYC